MGSGLRTNSSLKLTLVQRRQFPPLNGPPHHEHLEIAPNEPGIPHTKDDEGPPDPINTNGTHEQYVHNDEMITQPTDVPSGNNTEVVLLLKSKNKVC
ncbi:hypothetical protein Tco_0418448 [Tanacetum coccineum]